MPRPPFETVGSSAFACNLIPHTLPHQVQFWSSHRSPKYFTATPSSLHFDVRYPPSSASGGNYRSVAPLSPIRDVPTRRTRVFEKRLCHILFAISLWSCPGIASLLLRITGERGCADCLSCHPESRSCCRQDAKVRSLLFEHCEMCCRSCEEPAWHRGRYYF